MRLKAPAKKRIFFALVALALFSVLPTRVFAWGDRGHQLVVLIASRYLDANAHANVLRLITEDIRVNENYYKQSCPAVLALTKSQNLSDKDKQRLFSQALACMVIWPDPPYVKYDRPYTANWHFVDIPLTLRANDKPLTYSFDLQRECLHETAARAKSGDCALLAIERFRPILANPQRGTNYGESDERRAEALKFIMHIVGDIHQPLHCATDKDLTKPTDRGDAGGNGKIVEWLGRQTYTYGLWNLHAVWDEGILDKTLEAYQNKDDLMVELAYIDHLPLPAIGSPELAEMQEGDAFAWAYQSYSLAAEYAYGQLPAIDKNYEYPVLDRKTFKPVIDPNTGKPKKRLGGYRLTEDYYQKNKDIIDQQLISAGARLARILNEDLKN
jgi:hypothetical protein